MKKLLPIVVCYAFLAQCSGALAASPPWYYLQRQVSNSIGQSACSQVSELEEISESRFVIDVHACSAQAAKSLAFILVRRHDFGGVRVTVRVFDPDGAQVLPRRVVENHDPVGTVATHLQTALGQNPLFANLHTTVSPYALAQVWPVIAREVIQFWNDNIIDYYGNHNAVAATVFESVCKNSFFARTVNVAWSTSQPPE